MGKRWLTTNRDRLSQKFILLHKVLKSEIEQERKPQLSKMERHRAALLKYLQQGGP